MENDPDHATDELSSPVPPPVQESREPHHVTRRERRKHKKMIILIAGGATALLLVLGGLYWFVFKGNAEKQPTQTISTEKTTEPTFVPDPADPTPVVYKSTKLNIELTHRKDWTLKETSSGEITVTSPKTSYTGLDGKSKTGVFTLKVRIGVPEAMKATIEKSIAARDSEVIAYADPPETQRYYTNLSYAGSQKDAFNFFIVTGNTALKATNAFAYTLVLDSGFYLLAGGYGADKEGALSFESVAPSTIDSLTTQQAIDIVKSLKIF